MLKCIYIIIIYYHILHTNIIKIIRVDFIPYIFTSTLYKFYEIINDQLCTLIILLSLS